MLDPTLHAELGVEDDGGRCYHILPEDNSWEMGLSLQRRAHDIALFVVGCFPHMV